MWRRVRLGYFKNLTCWSNSVLANFVFSILKKYTLVSSPEGGENLSAYEKVNLIYLFQNADQIHRTRSYFESR